MWDAAAPTLEHLLPVPPIAQPANILLGVWASLLVLAQLVQAMLSSTPITASTAAEPAPEPPRFAQAAQLVSTA